MPRRPPERHASPARDVVVMRYIIADIFRRCQTSTAESLILQTLAQHANVLGKNARMSYIALSRATGFTERWVKELIRRLEERHLLRVYRRKIQHDYNAINTYDLVQPWLRARPLYPTAHMASERGKHPHTTRRENHEKIAIQVPELLSPKPITGDFLSWLGLSPGSDAYQSALGTVPN